MSELGGASSVETTISTVGSARSLPTEFEVRAEDALSHHFGTSLTAGVISPVPKKFDLVSNDGKIVGGAKFYSLVYRVGLPPAKFSIIAEHVWLVANTRADQQFQVFGNDERVPQLWLAKYGHLTGACQFCFRELVGVDPQCPLTEGENDPR